MRKTKTAQAFPTDNIKDHGEGIRQDPFFLRFGGDHNEAWCSSDWAGKHANPMFPSGEITVAQRMIATLHKSGVTQIAVITGPDDKKMEKQLAQYGVYFLQNPQPEKRIHRLRSAFVTCPVNVSGFI